MEVSAKMRGVRISPRKLQLVADQIRDRRVGYASSILLHGVNKASGIMKKLLDSVIANAENNHAADIDDLKVSYVVVNQGRTLKRMKARAKGRSDRILKRSSHIEIRLSDAIS